MDSVICSVRQQPALETCNKYLLRICRHHHASRVKKVWCMWKIFMTMSTTEVVVYNVGYKKKTLIKEIDSYTHPA